jgi:transposase InsO family protein
MGILMFLPTMLASRADLLVENLALRQQLAVLKRSVKRPKLRKRDRVFWVWLSTLWSSWRSILLIVQPETVIRWHRLGFKLYWHRKSKPGKSGRPKLDREIRNLIRRMSRENPLWGAPKILSELLLLGYEVSQPTVAKYMVKTRKPPSQDWRTFLSNHMQDIVACDFFTVPTATFRVLYVFIVLSHDRRRIVHFNITANPTAEWTGQQIAESFPFDEAPRFLLRDNDSIYGKDFTKRVESLGIEEVPTAPHSPWQNPYCERVIGSIRRECVDHMIVLNEKHLHRVLTSYFEYYHEARPHLSLDRNAPLPREIEPPSEGEVISIPQVGGLHHRYTRSAA